MHKSQARDVRVKSLIALPTVIKILISNPNQQLIKLAARKETIYILYSTQDRTIFHYRQGRNKIVKETDWFVILVIFNVMRHLLPDQTRADNCNSFHYKYSGKFLPNW